MKFIKFILILLTFYYFQQNLKAQNRFGILGGLSISNYTGKDFPKTYLPKIGIAAGFFIEGEITNPFSIVAELNFEQKGVKYWYQPLPLTEVTINSNLDYFSIPIYVKAAFGRKLGYYAYAGTVISYLISNSYSAYSTENDREVSWEPYFNYGFNKFDAGLAIGFGMVFKEIFLDLRYVHGIKNIYSGENIPDIRNQMISFKAGFSIYKRKLSNCYQTRRR
ncbi:MAG: PorT family protein [Bacteroidales bacterium]|nr:PorT family protein [Bacteroidales bacterium]MBN2758232.1 PorT family protein [Bacteroidales bacterium]